MANSSAYTMLQVAATLDGVAIDGLWDGDDAIVVTPAVDAGTGMVGADGSSIWSQSADNSVTISIKLQHTSRAHQRLHQKLKQARAGNLVGFPFDFIDKLSGEGGNADQCFIQTPPADSKGTVAVVREWILWTGNWNALIPTNSN